MSSKDNRAHRLPVGATKRKRSRRVTTIEDILARDDVNGILQELDKEKPHISDMLVIWLDKREGQFYYQMTDGTKVSTATWLLEATKFDVISEDTE